MSKNYKIAIIVLIVLMGLLHYLNNRLSWVKHFLIQKSNEYDQELFNIYFGPSKMVEHSQKGAYVFNKSFEEKLSDNLAVNRNYFDNLSLMSARLRNLESQVTYMEDVLRKISMNSPQLYFVSSKGREDILFETSIYKAKQDSNFGGATSFSVGGSNDQNIVRALIKANIPLIVPSKVKVLSAVLYVKMYRQNLKNSNLMGRSIYLYTLKKDWEEGNLVGAPALKDQATWNMVRASNEPWSTPGVWGDSKDVESEPSGYLKGMQVPLENTWVKIYFNEKGLKEIEAMASGQKKYGWLLKMDDEKSPMSDVAFYSMETRDKPYLEIIYKKMINLSN